MDYIISNKGVVNCVVAGKTYTFDKNHPNYTKLVGHLIDSNAEYFEAEYDVHQQLITSVRGTSTLRMESFNGMALKCQNSLLSASSR